MLVQPVDGMAEAPSALLSLLSSLGNLLGSTESLGQL